ncbi:hypothetical protein QAD02_004438 [Eretmocerus hayati]|uniref:Uncharacterized protein n=1 Tax=Eretmocerus hayati TaxID=131215 RepID=A0ACC2NPW3_9HYME|nr:hypothetical protein QAD02_004438 [Eretmocerus hayati]
MQITYILGFFIVGISTAASIPARFSPEISTEIPDSTIGNGTDDCEVDIDFSNMGLSTIKRNFLSGLKIKSVTLQHNSISKFEVNTFDSLPNLEHLDISNNVISKANLFSFGTVPSLKALILDNNSVVASTTTHINVYNYNYNYDGCSADQYYDGNYGYCVSRFSALEMKFDFPEVTHLSMRNIAMNSISNYWSLKFPKLMMLDVSNNRLSPPDDFFEKLPSTVENLTMENVGFTSLSIKSLKNITTLNLKFNQFESVNSNYCYEKTLCLKNLNELKNLLISGCSIKKIETDAFKDSQKLIHLDISNNSLSEIPHGAFELLHSLSYLDMSQNLFVKIPDIGSLKNLKTLKLDEMKNELIMIDLWYSTSVSNIQSLSLRGNKIKYIPENFLMKLQELEEIDLSNNQLTSLSPGSWQKNLSKLYLNQNRISDIDDLELKQATSLELLDLEKNNITNIKLSAIKQLPDAVILKV